MRPRKKRYINARLETRKFKDMEQVQIEFDALIQQFGAEAVIAAIKGHVMPNSGGGCTPTSCPKHYICNTSTGDCVLDLGIRA